MTLVPLLYHRQDMASDKMDKYLLYQNLSQPLPNPIMKTIYQFSNTTISISSYNLFK